MVKPLVPASAAPSALSSKTASLNAWIEVDVEAVEANVRALQAAVGSGVELIAVVKANAYGAGAAGLGPALERLGVPRFAVVWVPEGVALRGAGVTRPIIVLGHAFPEDAQSVVQHDIITTCHSLDLGRALSAAAAAHGATASVHIKVDTGLHRFGVEAERAVSLAEELRALPGIRVEGLTTHMANADEADDSFADEQHARFAEVAGRLSWIPYRHTANSATALRRSELRYQGVRVGLALHGILPPNTPDPGLRPILSLKARVARVSTVEPGEGVSYGLTWHATRPSRVGLVPVGYADGWRRSLGNRGRVLIGGQSCPMVGRVCMDQFVVDVTDVPGAAEGDEAVLIGEQEDEHITVGEIAQLEDTITWEVIAALQARLPRVFHRAGIVETVV